MRHLSRFIGKYAAPILMAGVMAASTDGAFAGPNTNFPFVDTFESYAELTPLINGTNGWYGNSSSIVVQTNMVYTGTNAAMIPLDCMLSNRFQNMPVTNVWLQMDVRPSLYNGTNSPTVNTNEAVMFYVNSNGYFVVHDGPTTNADNSANWVMTTNGGIGTSGTNWVQIGIYENFSRTNWDLYANGILVTNGIRFINASLTNFARFSVYNGGYHTNVAYNSTSYVDNVYVRAPGSISVNPNSVASQVMQGNVAANQSFLLSAQKGVWNFTNTTSATWFSVNPVTGILDLVTGATNVVVSYGAMPNGSYTGTVTITATSVDGGVIRTETVGVFLDVMDLQVTPTNLVTSTMAGYMPFNQSLVVTNAGGGTFAYSVTSTNDWIQSSTPSNGVLGSFASNMITVAYANSIMNWIGGVSNATIRIASTNGGGATQDVDVSMSIMARPVIELNPMVWTQTVDKGWYLTNEAFTIRNGSLAPVVPMQYTLSNGSPTLIQSLSSVGGVSTGQANSVTINYSDVSGWDAGSYTAIVQVAAHDAGSTYAPTGEVRLITNLTVVVKVVGPDAPSGVTASDGTYTNMVTVCWNPVTNSVKYIVYRSLTFDWTLVEPIGETSGTNIEDHAAVAGVLYYYWVSSVNQYLGEGAKSVERETGYRALSPPAGIFATSGTYTNKVHVTWPLVDGATGYRVYRRNVDIGDALAPVYFTPDGVFDDLTVLAGTHYEYRVGATNGICGSALSIGAIGYAFGAPTGVSASDGAYVGKVRVTWNALESASSYQVWRGTQAILPPGGGAQQVATVATPLFDDTSVIAGARYYYWVRGVSLVAGIGGWSERDSGYAAVAGVNLWVSDLVVLPIQVGAGQSPAIVSFRMGNGGGTNMTGANGTVKMELFASTNPVFGTGAEISIGVIVGQSTLAIGQDTVVNIDGSRVVLPGTEGDYYIFVRVLPEYPSLLVETTHADNVAQRIGVLRVRSSGGLNYQAFNDYDGDGMSDLGVYHGGKWSIRSVDGRVLADGATLFGAADLPVLGDLDGDRRSDPCVYASNGGMWQVFLSGSGYMRASGTFGGLNDRGLVADYEGVGHGTVSVFNQASGRWNVAKANGVIVEWNWGLPGFVPVIGDYDGDGRWDLAVYDEATALWYIRTLNGQLLISGIMFGGPGFQPVPGDYDGDGCWDAAIYEQATGNWYIASLDGRIFVWGIGFGFADSGYEPVMGDYDGDGKWDLAMYQESSGLWYIASLDGRILTWASPWGGSGYRPIGN